MKIEVVLAAGGTGGHFYPAVALCHILAAKKYKVTFIVDQRTPLTTTEFPDNVQIKKIYLPPLKGYKAWPKFMIVAAWQAFKLMVSFIKRRPSVVVGFGGYPVFPALLAAFITRVPIVLHEQNALLGRINRLFASVAARVALSFTPTLKVSPKLKTALTGNPVRPAFQSVKEEPYTPPQGKQIKVLILGGSQGARVMSQVVSKAMTDLPHSIRQRLSLYQQCRLEDIEEVRSLYKEHQIQAELKPFFDNVPHLLSECHLVISRSGASSLAEIACCGRPAILIPYQYAMEDHQAINALNREKAGAALILHEGKNLRDSLASLLENVLLDDAQLTLMASQMRSLGIPDAANQLAEVVEELIIDSSKAS